ncbi:hypothetical protein DAEQUDRAFT_762221 [Daedalea quercina L-15889]|uniref:non-specific serine/threonine protein kinase n=1 Tax=Daedalea quercina L-15889 TaxID=1314783 RepID=A0A165TDY1_9APHY|nr:hypothetical protein DAEQUDRAFT_762221 [Daedalea quercina L-15889]
MAAMAQAYPQAYMQPNKGTLAPGQTIAVNKYTVQVERYLSQGGFAHVYLVRTATPVLNTTHHVLKRIAVPNEGMLTEVKKEVDIMRILKGHSNIVYLIDAAWHRLPNGTYEVFILMEYCAGGGIIDMMNRRLRERLTEPEILTIFCDVCEGLAAMHSLKPPLLHRDLKVENILQASATVYKLCDFGSATPVQKVPSNVQEIRMLEADLNRHTTLQYRAPEMVDVYLRRPVDEKSDVWALGVLLYKLCYYTTPFEEHGPLAILNVQYKIPPYPVYSQQMNALIASMLREHGAQRPTVFELLDHVHRLRGTKSRFTYNVPPKAPLSPTRASASPLQTLSPNVVSPIPSQANALDELVSLKSRQPLSTSPTKNAGIEARERVLEAIAPMRRGRPPPVVTTQPGSPKKERAFELDMNFGADDDRVWRGVRGHKSGLAAVNAGSSNAQRDNIDAWGVGRKVQEQSKDGRTSLDKGFGDDFSSGFSKTFGDSFQPARSPMPSPKPQPTPSPRPPSRTTALNRNASVRKAKDAFDGLGLAAQPPPQTLGEARKSRTGLASMGITGSNAAGAAMASYLSAPGSQAPGLGTSNTSFRPPSSHAPMPSPSPRPAAPLAPSWRPGSSKGESLTAEERFPSLEELDREFVSPSPGTAAERFAMAHAPSQPASTEKLVTGSRPPSRAGYMANFRSAVDSTTGAGVSAPNGAAHTSAKRNMYEGLGARSQNVTGTAMRESRLGVVRAPSLSVRLPQVSTEPSRQERPRSPQKQRRDEDQEKPQDVVAVLRSRPSAARRRRTAGSKNPSRNNSTDVVSPVHETTPALPPRPAPEPSPRAEPRDWLTGADEDEGSAKVEAQPVMRESPSKRASFIERSPIQLVKPLEAEEVPANYERPKRGGGDPEKPATTHKPTSDVRPSWGRRESEKEAREERQRSPVRPKAFAARTASSAGTGANASAVGSANTRVLQLPPVDTRSASRSSVAPSPNGLTENWSPVVPAAEPAPLTAKSSSSSSSEEGPEDVSGFGAARNVKARTKGVEVQSTEDRRKQARSKGRQSSVHDLVDLWGGGLGEEKEPPSRTTAASSRVADATKRRSVIMPSPAARPPPLASKPLTRAESPQPLVDISLPGRSSNMRPPPSPHKRQPSATPSGSRMQATPMAAASSISPPMSGRSRPQSMFITSPSKSAYALQQPGPSPSPVPFTASTVVNALSPPADPRPRSGRRSSISDMVQHYEAITSTSSSTKPPPGPGPTSPTKPAPLNIRSKSSAGAGGDSSLPSPSAAATRFQKLSPTSSPVLSKASLAVPDDAGQGRAERDGGRRSPGFSGLPSRVSPVARAPETNGVVNGLPGRRSPLQLARETQAREREREQEQPAVPPSPSPFAGRKPVQSSVEREEPVRSPSPERPYQGVSRLIDRWQKAVDNSGDDAPRKGLPVKRAGVAR